VDLSSAPGWILLLVGLFGAGTLAKLAGVFVTRTRVTAEAESIRIGTLDQALQSLSRRVDELTREIGRLEGRVDRTEKERDWWQERAHQLESYIRDVANLPVPHPVTTEAPPGV
jgi:peptidoglycan hydrolase CwlO-like protein